MVEIKERSNLVKSFLLTFKILFNFLKVPLEISGSPKGNFLTKIF